METEDGNSTSQLASAHLLALGHSKEAAQRASVMEYPRWVYSLAPAFGTAVVWWITSHHGEVGRIEALFLQVGSIVIAASFLVGLVKVVRVDRRNPVQGHRKLRSKRWLNAFLASIGFPTLIIINLTSVSEIYQPYLFAIALFAWHHSIPPLLWRKHCQVVAGHRP